jgi:hypothetical protein
MKRYLPALSGAIFFGASSIALAASSIPGQAPEIPGNAGGGPVDCKQTPSDRNCVSMNPKNDSNSNTTRRSARDKRHADTTTSGRDSTGTMTYDSNKPNRSSSGSSGGSGTAGSPGGLGSPQNSNETPGPAGRSGDRVQ